MSDKIEPALSAIEWRRKEKRFSEWSVLSFGNGVTVEGSDPQEAVTVSKQEELAALIAAANDELPDDDRRKITRDWIRTLRNAADRIEVSDGLPGETDGDSTSLRAIADALQAYLPPEP